MSLLPGIPISDEQCIGDSLPILNNSFLALSSSTFMLSGQVDLLNNNLNLTAINLTNRLNLTAAALTQHLALTASSLTNHLNLTAATLTNRLNLTAASLTSHLNLTAVTLTNNITLTANALTNNINLTANSLLTVIRSISTLPEAVFITTATNFAMTSAHNRNMIFLNNNSTTPTKITKSGNFRPGHRTTFLQTGSATVTFVGFNALNGTAEIAGQYGVVEARFANNSSLPLSGWVIDGDLQPLGPEAWPFALSALPAPVGGEDPVNQISLFGDRPDTIYYYADPEPNLEFLSMNIYVNGYYRSQCDFTSERAGTLFGYRPAGFNPSTHGPVATGTFVNQTGNNVFFFIDGFNAEPTYFSLSASLQPNVQDDPFNGVAFSAINSGNVGDVMFYLADPDPDTVGEGQAIGFVRISTNGGSSYGPAVAQFDYTTERAGQLVGYKRAGVLGGPEGTITLPVTSVGGQVDLRFILPPLNRPTPTAPPPTPSSTAPILTPTPTITPQVTGTVVSLNALPSPGNEDLIHNIAFTADTNYDLPGNPTDTIYYSPRTLNSYEMQSPMIVYVNGARRSTVEFPIEFTGSQFGYRLNSPNIPGSGPNMYATFRAGRVDLTLPVVTPPGPTPTPTPTPAPGARVFSIQAVPAPGAEDPINQIAIIAENAVRNDTIFYNEIVYNNYTPASNPMVVCLSGVRRTTIEIPQDRVGTPFTYRLAGILDPNVPGNATLNFTTTTIDLSTTNFGFPRLSALSATLVGTDDALNQISIASTNVSFDNDALWYYHSSNASYQVAPPMTIRVNGTNRAVVTFPEERLGTPFGFTPRTQSGNVPSKFGIFKSGIVDMGTIP